MGMKLRSAPGALIPRPETEELVQRVVEINQVQAPAVLDVGTGSGCIAIALKKHLPNALVTAIDVSAEALQIATENAREQHVHIEFMNMDAPITMKIQKDGKNKEGDIYV